ncbi:MAG: extracellular solute-binding protein [Clostridiales bacterium]|nr:extracellular solute-binding protein [Clostridiales bacterium]
MKKIIAVLLALCSVIPMALTGCGKSDKEKILIYTSAEDYRVTYMQQRLSEQFPDYDIKIEYMSTGDHAAKLLSEGKDTTCDITYDLEYGYMQEMEDKGYLADLSGFCDFSRFDPEVVESNYYIPELRNGGAVIVNPDVISERGLTMPTSYQDLLDPQYKGLISMPNPKSSGTGYMFLRNLTNAWGEEAAFTYFDELTPNILQYTSSGSGPVNALLQKEAAIGFGMTAQAVTKINQDGANLKILFFEEGSPYSMYGMGILNGKETRQSVKDVFEFLYTTYGEENCEKFYPEKIYNDKTFDVENYPSNIKYGDMKDNTSAEKERLLAKWTH